MTAKIIDGNAVARYVRDQWKKRVDALKDAGITPGLAVLIVGENPASRVYVRNKVKACAEVGLHSETHAFPATATEAQVIALEKAKGAPIDGANLEPSITRTSAIRFLWRSLKSLKSGCFSSSGMPMTLHSRGKRLPEPAMLMCPSAVRKKFDLVFAMPS